MNIMIKSVSVKAHHSIDKVKRYYDSLRQVYEIITAKILEIGLDSALQMTLKTLNDFVDLNELVSTLLVFDAEMGWKWVMCVEEIEW
jgi:copper homeostasis protein CutC